MLRGTREEERLTEDESARIKLGPRGVPGGLDTAKMTPQQAKNIPKTGDFEGYRLIGQSFGWEPRNHSPSAPQPSHGTRQTIQVRDAGKLPKLEHHYDRFPLHQ